MTIIGQNRRTTYRFVEEARAGTAARGQAHSATLSHGAGEGMRERAVAAGFYRSGRLLPVLGDTESPTNWLVPWRFSKSRILPLAEASFSFSAASCGDFTGCWPTETMTSPGSIP